jgi:DNA-binding SARP family transcriptional activator
VIRLFGPLSIEDGARSLGPGDLGGVRPKQVLEILVAARGHRVPTDRLAELLWPDAKPRDAPGSLQTFVSMLRRRLTPDRELARRLVVTEHEAYRISDDLIALDLDAFDALLERSARQPTAAARASLEQALRLVRGEVLEDEPYAPWAFDLRSTYQGRVLGALLDAADAALAELDFAPALAHAEAARQLDPFSERAHRSELLALHALGRSQEALGRYRSFRTRLDADLGLEPAPETRAVEAAVIRGEDVHALLPRPLRRAVAPERCRVGVRLLGRAAELDTLDRAVQRGLDGSCALVHVEGETGLGKTRMLDELERRLDGTRIGRAHCSELERHLSYVPLATALRMALDDVPLDVTCMPALAEVLPELTLSLPGDRFDEVQVLEALVAIVAEHAPLALLIDDLQWADPRTLAALGYLRRRGGRIPIALVTTAVPAALANGPLPGLQPDVVIRLEPLSPGELTPLGRPDLHAATGGNPRFVAAALAGDPQGHRSRTLADALIAQCRAEGDLGYRALVAASVLPQPFAPEPLADLLDLDGGDLIEELERLCERRILRVDGLRFRFRYDLVRQVLLETISPARRRLLHERVVTSGGAVPFDRVARERAG